MKLMRSLPINFFLFLTITSCAFAQTETGQITGKVTDPTGAAVANATVDVKGTATGATRSTQTNGSGDYTVPNLLPGTYTVTANASGFYSLRAAGYASGRCARQLRILPHRWGRATSTVTVTENPVQVNTETQTLANIVTRTGVA